MDDDDIITSIESEDDFWRSELTSIIEYALTQKVKTSVLLQLDRVRHMKILMMCFGNI